MKFQKLVLLPALFMLSFCGKHVDVKSKKTESTDIRSGKKPDVSGLATDPSQDNAEWKSVDFDSLDLNAALQGESLVTEAQGVAVNTFPVNSLIVLSGMDIVVRDFEKADEVFHEGKASFYMGAKGRYDLRVILPGNRQLSLIDVKTRNGVTAYTFEIYDNKDPSSGYWDGLIRVVK